MKKITLLSVSAILFCCCKNVSKYNISSESAYSININSQKSKKINWNEKIEILKIIPLETNESALIQQIEKIYTTDLFVIIYDNKQEEIFIFDSTGNYQAKCGKRGSAPGEHIRFNDIFFEKTTNLIYAHEAIRRTMQIFDTAGNLVREFSTNNFWFQSFCKLQNNYWLYTGYMELNPKGYALMQVDEDMEQLINGYFPQKFFLPATFHSTFFENEKGDCFFSVPINNSIFQLNNQKVDLNPFFQINFGSQTIPNKTISEVSDRVMFEELLDDKEYMGNIGSFILFENNFFFTYSQLSNQSIEYFSWYEITQEKEYSYNGFSARNDQLLLQKPIGSHSNGLIFMIWPDLLSEEEVDYLETTCNHSISFESNPILVYTTNPL